MFRKTDRQVVRGVLAGRREEYGVLVERYGAVAHAVAYSRVGNRADAEDVTQEAFLAAFVQLGSLRDGNRFAPWLLTIVRHAAGKAAAKRRRETDDADALVAPVVLPDVERRELHDWVREQVMALEESARDVLLLYYFSGHNTREIARLLELSPDAVEKRLQRARAQVGAALLRELGMETENRSAATERHRRVMGLVATATVPWGHSTAAGILGGLLAPGATKVVVATAAVASIGALAVAYGAYRPSKDVGRAATVLEQASSSAGVAAAGAAAGESQDQGVAEGGADARNDESTVLKGSGRIAGRTIGIDERPMGDVELTLVETDWDTYEPHPASSKPLVFRSDREGRIDISGLPLRAYAVLARAEGLAGVTGVDLSEKEPKASVEIELLPSSRLAGRVVDGEGRAAPGVWVVPVVEDGDGRIMPRSEDGEGDEFPPGMAKALGVWTDAEGRFGIEHLTPGRWQLAALGKGFAWGLGPFAPADSDAVELRLVPESVIAGRVVDDQGRPVAEAEVVLGGDEPLETKPVHTGPDGAFRFGSLPAGAYELEVLHETLAPLERTTAVTLAAQEQRTDLQLQTRTGATVSGRLVDADSRNGIADATVDAAGKQYKEAKTDAEGQYRFAGLAPGTYRVGVRNAWGYRSFGEGPQTTLDWGQAVENVDFRISVGTAVSGRVIDSEGRPAADTPVYGFRGDQQEALEYTNGKGEFRIAALEPGKPLQLYAAKGRMIAQSEALEVPVEGLKGVALKLEPGVCLHGRVVDAEGNRVRSPAVYIERDESRLSFWGEISISARGKFDALGLLPGTYSLSAATDRKSKRYGAPVQVTAKPGEEVEGLVLSAALRTPGNAVKEYDVNGLVLDERGQPVPGVGLSYSDSSGAIHGRAITDEHGLFTLEDVPAGGNTLRVEGERFRADALPIKVPVAGRVQINGTRLGRIEGRVIGPDGQPVREFLVRNSMSAESWVGMPLMWPDRESPVISDSGSFTIDPAAEYEGLVVWAKGFTPAIVPTPVIAPGETRKAFVVRLAAETVVVGRVVGADGKPVAEAAVYARAVGADESPSDNILPARTGGRDLIRVATADGEGRFEARGLPAAALRLWASDGKHKAESLIVTPEPGRTVKADFALGYGARIEGTVTVGGKPVGDVEVGVHVSEPLQPNPVGRGVFAFHGGLPILVTETARTDAQGHFAFDGLPSGMADVSASIPLPGGVNAGSRYVSQRATIEVGQRVQLDLVCRDDGAEVSGKITAGGALVISGEVNLQSEEGASVRFPAKDGVFRCGGLPAGKFDARVSNAKVAEDDYRHSEQPVEIELHAGESARLDFDLP